MASKKGIDFYDYSIPHLKMFSMGDSFRHQIKYFGNWYLALLFIYLNDFRAPYNGEETEK